jgi:hypothetical protein
MTRNKVVLEDGIAIVIFSWSKTIQMEMERTYTSYIILNRLDRLERSAQQLYIQTNSF